MGVEFAAGTIANVGVLVTFGVDDCSGATIGVRDGTWVGAAGQVGEANKDSPVGTVARGATVLQAVKPSMEQAARPHIILIKLMKDIRYIN